MSSTEKIEAQKSIIEIARRIIDGKGDLTEDVRQMLSHLSHLKVDFGTKYQILRVFENATDNFPPKRNRSLWQVDKFDEKMRELAVIEEKYRPGIAEACREIESYLNKQQY